MADWLMVTIESLIWIIDIIVDAKEEFTLTVVYICLFTGNFVLHLHK